MSGEIFMGVPKEKIGWYPEIDHSRCSGCGECVEFCDNGVFEMRDGRPVVVEPLNCVVGCDSCRKVCPADAIIFPAKEKLVEKVKRLQREIGGGCCC